MYALVLGLANRPEDAQHSLQMRQRTFWLLLVCTLTTLVVCLVPRAAFAAAAGMCGPHATTQTAPLPVILRPEASLDALDENLGCGGEGHDHMLTQGERIPNFGDIASEMCASSTMRLLSISGPSCVFVEWPPEASSLGSAHHVRVDRPPR